MLPWCPPHLRAPALACAAFFRGTGFCFGYHHQLSKCARTWLAYKTAHGNMSHLVDAGGCFLMMLAGLANQEPTGLLAVVLALAAIPRQSPAAATPSACIPACAAAGLVEGYGIGNPDELVGDKDVADHGVLPKVCPPACCRPAGRPAGPPAGPSARLHARLPARLPARPLTSAPPRPPRPGQVGQDQGPRDVPL
jgi:hypothetical protein